MSKQTKTYSPKSLIDGEAIGEAKGTSWVAVPDKFADNRILVNYENLIMIIEDWRKEAQQFKRFRDRFYSKSNGRKQYYTLGYFKFVPDDELSKMEG